MYHKTPLPYSPIALQKRDGMMRAMASPPRRLLYWLAQPALMFFALPWLMALLTLGTVSQRYIGLYASQKLFFGSFLLWAGMVPLPGAYSTLSLIALSLLAKLLLKSPFGVKQAGTILIHVSMLVLLVGGLVSALMREEGYLVLGDGDSAKSVLDYRQRDLVLLNNGEPVKTMPFAGMRAGDVYKFSALPFTLQVQRVCFPCGARARVEPRGNLRGVAAKLELISVPYSKQDEQNLTGMDIGVSGAGAADGTYIAFEGLSEPEAVTINGIRYAFALRPASRPLPFSVRLLHFAKSDYPGTDEARAYRSDVAIKDGGLEWNAAIEMNQPLRYKGYTLYQSSCVDGGGRLMSVLAVVKNAGEWFPYIALFMLCAGLVAHVLIVLRSRDAR
jgi:hypothetical protein